MNQVCLLYGLGNEYVQLLFFKCAVVQLLEEV